MVDLPTPRDDAFSSRPGRGATAIWDDFGVRFEYPADWDLDVSEDGTRTTVSVQAPDGMAFAFVSLDEGGDAPSPEDLAAEALQAMRAEYPDLEAADAREEIDGHLALGHDLTFFSLDVPGGCVIRAFRTERRTVLVFGQWSDLDSEEVESQVRLLRRTLEETDS